MPTTNKPAAHLRGHALESGEWVPAFHDPRADHRASSSQGAILSALIAASEVLEVMGLPALNSGEVPDRLTVRVDDIEFSVRLRIDTSREAAYYRHGGILTYVLRQLAGAST